MPHGRDHLQHTLKLVSSRAGSADVHCDDSQRGQAGVRVTMLNSALPFAALAVIPLTARAALYSLFCASHCVRIAIRLLSHASLAAPFKRSALRGALCELRPPRAHCTRSARLRLAVHK